MIYSPGALKDKNTIFILMCLKYQIKYGYNMQRRLSVIDFFPFAVLVVGSKGGMSKVENKSV